MVRFSPLQDVKGLPEVAAVLTEGIASGNYLHVPSGVDAGVVEHATVGGEEQTLIVLDKDSRAEIVLKHTQDRKAILNVRVGACATLVLREIYDGAKDEIERVFRVDGQGSLVHEIVGASGSQEQKNDYVLAGEEARVEVRGAQYVDCIGRKIKSKIHHKAPRTHSVINLKGVVQHVGELQSSAVVVMDPEAQKSTSHMEDHALLLSDQARAMNRPSMEIEPNDVTASHAASATQLNEENIFYAMSRGISRDDAVQMIIKSFLDSAVPGASAYLGEVALDTSAPVVEAKKTADAVSNTLEGIQRAQYPILSEVVRGKPLVYLDNAATTQKPQHVIDAITHYYKTYNSNVHRGVHTLSQDATSAYEEVREQVATFIGCDRDEVVFTKGTTDGMNLLAASLGGKLKEGDVVLLSQMEHHSNIVPWQRVAKERGATVHFVSVDQNGVLDSESLALGLSLEPKIVSITHVSNVSGMVNDVKAIAERVHAYGGIMVVDGAQSAPHMKINVKDLGCDAYAFSAHKMQGPTGVGVLYLNKGLMEKMAVYQSGGGMIERVTEDMSTYKIGPEMFEAGTPNIAGTVGFGAAIDFIQGIGMEVIEAHEKELMQYAVGVLGVIPQVQLYGRGERVGSLAFNVEGYDSYDIGVLLDTQGIAIRSGHHCAQVYMQALDLAGVCRMSIASYNSKEDIDALAQGITTLLSKQKEKTSKEKQTKDTNQQMDHIYAQLATVEDPELHMDIMTLGLIRDVKVTNGSCDIIMTLTSPMCPFGQQLVNSVEQAVLAVEGIEKVHVELSFNPPWEPPEDVKLMLGV